MTRLKKTILGFDREINILANRLCNNDLPNCLILSGPKEAELKIIALNLASSLVKKQNFNSVDEACLSLRNIEDYTNPYILLIEKIWLEDKKKYKKKIFREDISYILDFFSTKDEVNQKRVCLINSLDDLSKDAVNSLLKIVEEPNNNSHFILINHKEVATVPTIKSRSHIVKFKYHRQEEFIKIIENYYPQMENKEIKNLFNLSKGSINFVKKYLEYNFKDMDSHLTSVLRNSKNIKPNTVFYYIDFVKKYSDKDEVIETFFDFISLKINETTINACKENNVCLINKLSKYYSFLLNLREKYFIYNLNFDHTLITYFYFIKNV